MRIQKIISLIHVFTIIHIQLIAGGSDLATINSSKTFALNGMYIAGIDGIGVLISNPANLSSIRGFGFELTLADKIGTQYFENEVNGEYESFRTDDLLIGVGVFWNINSDFTLALGYLPILSYYVDWPYTMIRSKGDNSLILAFDYYNKIKITSITPGISYKSGKISLGISANIYQTQLGIAYPLDNDFWYADSGRAAYQVNYDLDGWAYGYTIGLTYEFNNSFTAAISARSSFSADLEGKANSQYFSDIFQIDSQTSLKSEFEMPWIISAGIFYKINDNFAFNIDSRLNLWSNVKNNFNFEFDNEIWESEMSDIDSSTGINGTSFNSNYRNSFDVGVGFEYVTSNISYRAGYRFSQSPQNDSMYSMLLCTVDQHWLTAGIGLREENWIIDLTLAYSIGIKKEISGAKIPILDGIYSADSFVPSLTLRYIL